MRVAALVQAWQAGRVSEAVQHVKYITVNLNNRSCTTIGLDRFLAELLPWVDGGPVTQALLHYTRPYRYRLPTRRELLCRYGEALRRAGGTHEAVEEHLWLLERGREVKET